MTTTFNLADLAIIPVKIATPSHTRTSLDLTYHPGFKQGEGCYTFAVIDITFQLRHRFGLGWLAESDILDKPEIFETCTKPGEIAQRLEDIVCAVAQGQGESNCTYGDCKYLPKCQDGCLGGDADWQTAALPDTGEIPERWQSPAERYGLAGDTK